MIFNGETLRRRVEEKFKTYNSHQGSKNTKRSQVKNIFKDFKTLKRFCFFLVPWWLNLRF